MDEQQKILPNGWKWVKLGDILRVSSGKGLKVNDLSGGKYAVYGGNGINGYHSEYLIDEPKLIIGRVGVRCGVTYITKPKSWITDNALIVEPKIKDFDLRYFKLKLGYENLNKLSVSTAQPVISGSKIYACEISIPPYNEQQAIVSKIEELFSELDNGIAQLKTAQQQLNTYRQSVLKWAFEGRLTNDNVKDGELPEGWKWVKLGEVADAIDPQPSHRTPAISEDGIPYVGIGEVDKETGKIDFDNARKVSKIVLKEHVERYNLYDGDFIIGKIGTIGKPFKIPSKRFFTLSANVVLIQSNRSKVLPNYLFYLTKSTIIEKQFSSGSKATTQAAFGIKKVRELIIPICSIDEQKLLGEEIDRRLSVSDKLQETIETALAQSESLRQSILKQAFEGKLVKN